MSAGSLIGDDKPADTAEESGRKMDSELRVMGQILRLLTDLGDDAADRVVAYLSARWAAENKE